MNSPVVNTKIERVVEAIEGLTVAVTANVHRGGAFEDVKTARGDLTTALQEFMQPALRVVGGTAQ